MAQKLFSIFKGQTTSAHCARSRDDNRLHYYPRTNITSRTMRKGTIKSNTKRRRKENTINWNGSKSQYFEYVNIICINDLNMWKSSLACYCTRAEATKEKALNRRVSKEMPITFMHIRNRRNSLWGHNKRVKFHKFQIKLNFVRSNL